MMTNPVSRVRERNPLESVHVQRAIRRRLRDLKIYDDVQDDLTQDVYERACKVQPPPSSEKGWIALAREIAHGVGIDYIRAQEKRREVIAGPANADAHASRAYDASPVEILERTQKLNFLHQQTQQGGRKGRAAAIAVMFGVGEKVEDIAKYFGIKRQTVSNLATMGRGGMAAAGILLLVGLAVWLLPSQREKIANPPPGHLHQHDAPEPTPLDKARELRRRALRDCDMERWEECVRGLDQAAELDRAGDRDAAVQRARTNAVQHLSSRPSSSAPAP